MAKEMKVREIKDVPLILVDKEEIQRPAHTIILQDIVSLPVGKNILKSRQTLKIKLNSIKRLPIPTILQLTESEMAFFLILCHS